jgi:hypothetical protein
MARHVGHMPCAGSASYMYILVLPCNSKHGHRLLLHVIKSLQQALLSVGIKLACSAVCSSRGCTHMSPAAAVRTW